MRKSLLSATLFYFLGAGSMLLACGGDRPNDYSYPDIPVYQPEPPPDVFAVKASSGYQVAGLGVGGALLTGSALVALRKRA